jgi:hypothetical protein
MPLNLGDTITFPDGTIQTTAATTEAIQDIIGALLAAGANVTVTYNDAANTLTIASDPPPEVGAESRIDANAMLM